jgi:hypothetical protein
MTKTELRNWLRSAAARRQPLTARETFALIFEPSYGWEDDADIDHAIDRFCEQFEDLKEQVLVPSPKIPE